MKIDREIAYRLGEARALANMGVVYRDRGERDKALEWLRQSLAIFEEIGAGLHIEKTRRIIEDMAGGGE